MQLRKGTLRRARAGQLAGRPAGLLGAAAAVLLAAALPLASAGPARADSGPAGAASGLLSHDATHLRAATSHADVQTPSIQYSCDFSGYGTGIAPATVAAQYEYADSWPANNPDDIFLTVPADSNGTLALPQQVSSQLNGVNQFEVQATVSANNATAATAAIDGFSTQTLPNPPTAVPQVVSEGQVTFAAQGTGTISLPPASITITPEVADSSGNITTSDAAITCTTTTTAQDVTITVGTASGPFYMCTFNDGSGAPSTTESGLINMTVTASGPRTVGATDTVKLSSADLASSGVLPSGVTATFAASLAVTGAQSGSVSVTGPAVTTGSNPLVAKGTLSLSAAGTISLLLPQTLTIT